MQFWASSFQKRCCVQARLHLRLLLLFAFAFIGVSKKFVNAQKSYSRLLYLSLSLSFFSHFSSNAVDTSKTTHKCKTKGKKWKQEIEFWNELKMLIFGSFVGCVKLSGPRINKCCWRTIFISQDLFSFFSSTPVMTSLIEKLEKTSQYKLLIP